MGKMIPESQWRFSFGFWSSVSLNAFSTSDRRKYTRKRVRTRTHTHIITLLKKKKKKDKLSHLPGKHNILLPKGYSSFSIAFQMQKEAVKQPPRANSQPVHVLMCAEAMRFHGLVGLRVFTKSKAK